MKTKRFTAKIALASLITLNALGMNVISAIHPLPLRAQVLLSCNAFTTVSPSFSGNAAPSGVNIRSSPSLNAAIVGKLAPNQRAEFDAWAYGDSVQDVWAGWQDKRWYRLRGTNNWVASGVIRGNPPSNPPRDCTPTTAVASNFFNNREAFFNWANGQRGIARLDTTSYRGQCVSLVARYVQEVFLTGADRTRSRTFGNGKDTAGSVANQFSQKFEPLTRTGLPRRGAAISFPGPNTLYGHTGIVMEARMSGNIRQIRMMESNWDLRAENSAVRIGDWVNLDGRNSYGGVNGWTNPR